MSQGSAKVFGIGLRGEKQLFSVLKMEGFSLRGNDVETKKRNAIHLCDDRIT